MSLKYSNLNPLFVQRSALLTKQVEESIKVCLAFEFSQTFRKLLHFHTIMLASDPEISSSALALLSEHKEVLKDLQKSWTVFAKAANGYSRFFKKFNDAVEGENEENGEEYTDESEEDDISVSENQMDEEEEEAQDEDEADGFDLAKTRDAAIATPPVSPPTAPVSKKRKRKQRVLNIQETLKKYVYRMETELPRKMYLELHGTYLSDFGLLKNLASPNPDFCTRQNFDKGRFTSHAQCLTMMANEVDSCIRGYTNENKTKGEYVEKIPENESRVYIGNKNAFTKHEVSEWALLSVDKVFLTV